MTEPVMDTVTAASLAEPLPTGVRVASTICWLVGILTILIVFAVGIPAAAARNASYLPLSLNVLAGIAVCVAGYLVRKGRKVGALLVVLAWASPTLTSLATGGGARGGSFLLLAAMLALAANWKHLR